MNTTVTIQFSNGESRHYTASDLLEKMIQAGEMFSVVSLHPDQGDAELCRMYAGNPAVALGCMIALKDQIDQMPNQPIAKSSVEELVTTCIGWLSQEITSHGSAMEHMERH